MRSLLPVAPWMPGGDPALRPLVFMAATLGGMMRAPIMSVMFGFELTHDVDALLPMLVASAVAYGFTVLTMSRSILTEKIARRGRHALREYGIDPLERHAVAEVMTRDGALRRVGALFAADSQEFALQQRFRMQTARDDGEGR